MFHNNAFIKQESEVVHTVPFHSLKHGDKFKKVGIHQIIKRDEESITYRRSDGWLIRINKDHESWNSKVTIIGSEEPEYKGLEAAMQNQLKKIGRTKFKALVSAVSEGLITQKMPDGVTKEQWVLTAKKTIDGN